MGVHHVSDGDGGREGMGVHVSDGDGGRQGMGVHHVYRAYYFLAVSYKCCGLVPIVEIPDPDNAFPSTTDKSCG